MKSNLQASKLINSLKYLTYLESELIELDYKKLKKLKVGSWLEIKNDNLKTVLIKDKSIIESKLYSIDSYLALSISDNIKDYKFKIPKNHFRLKIDINKDINISDLIINKQPAKATLKIKKKDFANVNLYINNKIYIEIIELKDK